MENVLISGLEKSGGYLWIPFYRKPPTHTVWVEKSLIKDKILRFNETTIHANYVKGLCSQNILCEKDFIPRTLFPFLMKQERSTTKFFYVWRLSMLIFHSWSTTFQKADDNIWGTRSGWFGWLVQFQVQVRESLTVVLLIKGDMKWWCLNRSLAHWGARGGWFGWLLQFQVQVLAGTPLFLVLLIVRQRSSCSSNCGWFVWWR